jgi:3-oxoadipate enol-lactonase
VNLHHQLEGPAAAPVLVLAHSLGTTLELWDPNVPNLARHVRVLRYDQRGHGRRSPVPPGPYTVEELASDLLELLDELGLERVAFCGISLGGAVGLWLGAEAPERIEKLVVACSSARFGPPEPWLERAEIVRAQGMSAISEAVVQRWFTSRLQRDNPELVSFYRRMLEATPPEGYAASCEAVAAWDFGERLPEVHIPTLVISAADDPSTPPEHGRRIAEGISAADLALVEHAAHLANVERSDEFCRLVARHVGSRIGEPA